MGKSSSGYAEQFNDVARVADDGRSRALEAAGRELISMYMAIGSYVSDMVGEHGWKDDDVSEFAAFLQTRYPGVKGFSLRNILSMKQFFETYGDREKLSPLVREISWTSNLLIMAKAESDEEREFYLRLCIDNSCTRRELERLMDGGCYERYMMSSKKPVTESGAGDVRKRLVDIYLLDFLGLSEPYSGTKLRHAVIGRMKKFILESGKDFTFMGEDYRISVGGEDYLIDLLFYNRALSCLVPFELKTGAFKPEYAGEMDFLLEALDRDVKYPDENPSAGVIICTDSNETVVDYSLSRSLSPALVSDYRRFLPDRQSLRDKLREITDTVLEDEEDEAG